MGFKHVFDNLTVKHMDALRKQIQSIADFVLKVNFRMIARNDLL